MSSRGRPGYAAGVNAQCARYNHMLMLLADGSEKLKIWTEWGGCVAFYSIVKQFFWTGRRMVLQRTQEQHSEGRKSSKVRTNDRAECPVLLTYGVSVATHQGLHRMGAARVWNSRPQARGPRSETIDRPLRLPRILTTGWRMPDTM